MSSDLAALVMKQTVITRVHEALVAGLARHVPAEQLPGLSVALRTELAVLPTRDLLQLAIPYPADLEAEVEFDRSVTFGALKNQGDRGGRRAAVAEDQPEAVPGDAPGQGDVSV